MTTTGNRKMDETGEVRALRSAALTGEAVPRRVLLAPWGQVESTNGSFVVDEESVKLVLEAFEEHGTDLPIDYEHQTLGGTYSSPSGQAPAAGWIRRLLSEPGVGLLAEIEWTDHAKEVLSAKEYRYLSPVVIIRKSDRKLVALHSAALTNKPAIVGMKPIVNRSDAPSADPNDEAMALLRTELKMSPDAGPHEVLVAASECLVNLQQQARQRHVEERITQALRAGKLVEAQRGWAESLVACEEELFDEWLQTAPVVVLTGATVAPAPHEAARRNGAAATRARAEFRANSILSALTSEDAYVADALRQS